MVHKMVQPVATFMGGLCTVVGGAFLISGFISVGPTTSSTTSSINGTTPATYGNIQNKEDITNSVYIGTSLIVLGGALMGAGIAYGLNRLFPPPPPLAPPPMLGGGMAPPPLNPLVPNNAPGHPPIADSGENATLPFGRPPSPPVSAIVRDPSTYVRMIDGNLTASLTSPETSV